MPSSKNIAIRPVRTPSELRSFIKLPWKIYRGNDYWVPPLISEEKKLLDIHSNPFFEHSEAQFYLAKLDGEEVGRIAAMVNHNHNEFHNERTGFFGFFECIDNQEAADGLFAEAVEWLRGKKMDTMRGPMNPSTNDTIGFLVDAFDASPQIMMTYTHPYYLALAENFGFKKLIYQTRKRFY